MEENIADLMKLEQVIETFVETYANSFVKWELIQFFHDHPRAPFQAESLAQALNRPAKVLRKELRELARGGLLKEGKAEKAPTFSYAPGDAPRDQELRAALEQFIALCQEREGRLRVIYQLLKTGKPI